MAAQQSGAQPGQKSADGIGQMMRIPSSNLPPQIPGAVSSHESIPPRLGEHVGATTAAGRLNPVSLSGSGVEDAPPSYEDAMALDMAPVDGRRRDYHLSPSEDITTTATLTAAADTSRSATDITPLENQPPSLSSNVSESRPNTTTTNPRVESSTRR